MQYCVMCNGMQNMTHTEHHPPACQQQDIWDDRMKYVPIHFTVSMVYLYSISLLKKPTRFNASLASSQLFGNLFVGH